MLRTSVLEIAYGDHRRQATPRAGRRERLAGRRTRVDACGKCAGGGGFPCAGAGSAWRRRYPLHPLGDGADGTAVALAQDVVDLADGLGLDRFAVVGHDWGGRTAYTLAARSVVLPDFAQCQRLWYQWLLLIYPFPRHGVGCGKRGASVLPCSGRLS